MSHSLLLLKDINKDDGLLVGQRAERLGEMSRAGIPIPLGFVITASAYFTFIRDNHLSTKINDLLATASYDHADSLGQVALHIKRLIQQTKLSNDLVKEIYTNYTKLGSIFRNPSLTVTFSPTRHIQQPQTTWHLQGEVNLILKIREAWSLLFEPDVLFFHHKHHSNPFQTGMAIIVQKQVNPELSGEISHDEITYNQASRNLNEKQKNKLIEIGNKIAEICNAPQTVEWAVEKNKLYILNTRPDTHTTESIGQPVTRSLLLISGESISPGIATGPLKIIANEKDFNKSASGDVLLVSHTELPYFPSLSKTKKPAAIIAMPNPAMPLTTKRLLTQTLKHLGIPAIIVTNQKSKMLKDGLIVTANGTKGHVYQGALQHMLAEESNLSQRKTATKIFAAVTSDEIAPLQKQQFDGVEFLGIESLVKHIGIHPHQLLLTGKKHLLINELTKQLETICKTLTPQPVLYKLADLRTTDFHGLKDDQHREMHETNPILGYRGTFRALNDPLLLVELEVIKHLREEKNILNLHILLPFVRTVQELYAIKEILKKYNLHRSPNFKLWLGIETPANVISLEQYIEAGIDGVRIDLDSLTTLILGIDKQNHAVSHFFDEQDPAVLWAVEKTIKIAQQHHLPSSLIYPYPFPPHSLFEKIVRWGISNVAILPNNAEKMRQAISEAEKKLFR